MGLNISNSKLGWVTSNCRIPNQTYTSKRICNQPYTTISSHRLNSQKGELFRVCPSNLKSHHKKHKSTTNFPQTNNKNQQSSLRYLYIIPHTIFIYLRTCLK